MTFGRKYIRRLIKSQMLYDMKYLFSFSKTEAYLMVSVGTDFMSGIPRGLITEPVCQIFKLY